MKVIEPVNAGDKYLIVYHREDNDGLFSMAILYQYLVHQMNVETKNIDLFGANYQEMSEANVNNWLKQYTHILMTDISLPVEKMSKIYKKLGENFIWIDHHAPIITETNEKGLGDILGSRRTDRSAIMNAYDFLYNPFHLEYVGEGVRCPELLKVLSAFDSFTFEIQCYKKEYVVNVNTAVTNEFMLDVNKILAYVNTYLYGFSSDTQFDEFNTRELNRFLEAGTEYNRITDANHFRLVREYGSDFTVDGNRNAIGIFSIEAVGSGWFAEVAAEYENGIIFKRMKNGRWIISLYNTDEHDKSFHCGEYLKKKYKGGGHQGAAGCQVDEEVILKILKSKKV